LNYIEILKVYGTYHISSLCLSNGQYIKSTLYGTIVLRVCVQYLVVALKLKLEYKYLLLDLKKIMILGSRVGFGKVTDSFKRM